MKRPGNISTILAGLLLTAALASSCAKIRTMPDTTPQEIAMNPVASNITRTVTGPVSDGYPTEDSGDALSAEAKSVSRLVIPTESLTNEEIELVYRLSGSDTDLTYTTTTTPTNVLGTTWVHGKKYIYNITITPKEIKFNPSVNEWDANTGIDGEPEDDADDEKDIEL